MKQNKEQQLNADSQTAIEPNSVAPAGSNAMLAAALTEVGKFMGKNFEDPMNYMYDKKWDWLMPVVEKIENLDCVAEFSIVFNNACIFLRNDGTRTDLISNQTNNKIEAVFKTVVDFVKWYNVNAVAKGSS